MPVILVMLESDGWVIKRGHPRIITSIHATKRDAVVAARAVASEHERLVVIDAQRAGTAGEPLDEH